MYVYIALIIFFIIPRSSNIDVYSLIPTALYNYLITMYRVILNIKCRFKFCLSGLHLVIAFLIYPLPHRCSSPQSVSSHNAPLTVITVLTVIVSCTTAVRRQKVIESHKPQFDTFHLYKYDWDLERKMQLEL